MLAPGCAIYIHGNTISGGGNRPAGRAAQLAPVLGNPVPGIIYDGVLRPKTSSAKICIDDNGDATFVNYDAGNKFKSPTRDLKQYTCKLPPLQPVVL